MSRPNIENHPSLRLGMRPWRVQVSKAEVAIRHRSHRSLHVPDIPDLDEYSVSVEFWSRFYEFCGPDWSKIGDHPLRYHGHEENCSNKHGDGEDAGKYPE